MKRSVSIAAMTTLLAGPLAAAPANVVTDIPAVGSLVQQVMGDLAEVRVLLPDGASAHHYQMRPSDAQALQGADLVVWMGPELTPWLDRAAQNLAGDTARLQLLTVEGIQLLDYAASDHGRGHDKDHGHDKAHDDHDHDASDAHEHSKGHDHEHDDHHGHGHDHDHAHDDHHEHGHDHDHAHDGLDPHAWLDPANAGPWLSAIAEALAEHDPDNAATYAANAQAAATDIEAMTDELTAQLSPYAQERFVVFHDAYGYFTNRFGLQPAIPVALGDASTPSAARIESVRAQISGSGARCAFPEYAHDVRLIETAIEGLDVRLGAVIDPQGGSADDSPQRYQETLRNIAQAISDCFAAE